jgi:hypothetical protein
LPVDGGAISPSKAVFTAPEGNSFGEDVVHYVVAKTTFFAVYEAYFKT